MRLPRRGPRACLGVFPGPGPGDRPKGRGPRAAHTSSVRYRVVRTLQAGRGASPSPDPPPRPAWILLPFSTSRACALVSNSTLAPSTTTQASTETLEASPGRSKEGAAGTRDCVGSGAGRSAGNDASGSRCARLGADPCASPGVRAPRPRHASPRPTWRGRPRAASARRRRSRPGSSSARRRQGPPRRAPGPGACAPCRRAS